MLNVTGDETLDLLGNEEYEKYHCNLLATGMGGLEHHNGVYIAEQYATSSEIPESDKYFDDYPSTLIPIPAVEERCEKKCCSITMIPLRNSIAITIHKC